MEIQAIKQYMKANKITYDELSNRTGLSKSCITKIFAGYAKYPRVDTMQAIERALGLAPSFTDKERALGVVENNSTSISDEEWNLLERINRATQVLGKEYVQMVLEMLDLNVERKLKEKR